MMDPFINRVRAAAAASWWTVLVAVVFATVLWTVYLLTMSYRPAWWLALCGPNITWTDIQHVVFDVIVAFKFVVWLMALFALWLTLWGRELRKRQGA